MLTRRVGESIEIGNEVTITVIALYGGQIRIGIDAPKDTVIVRTELKEPTSPQHVSVKNGPANHRSRHFHKK